MGWQGNLLVESNESVKMRKLVYFSQYVCAGMNHCLKQWTLFQRFPLPSQMKTLQAIRLLPSPTFSVLLFQPLGPDTRSSQKLLCFLSHADLNGFCMQTFKWQYFKQPYPCFNDSICSCSGMRLYRGHSSIDFHLAHSWSKIISLFQSHSKLYCKFLFLPNILTC